MSRSGYCDEYDDQWRHIMWRGTVASSIRGKRGQDLLRRMLSALDAMEPKELISHDLVRPDGACCALGALAKSEGRDVSTLDPEDYMTVAGAFNVASPLIREIVYMNDDGWFEDTPAARWTRMRAWVASQIKDPNP